MGNPVILDLLDPPLSRAEAEHAGQTLLAFTVEVYEGIEPEVVTILATDSHDAINRAFDILYPDWDAKKPTSGIKIKVTALKKSEPRFKNVFCSQCGCEFGPGDSGFSHCSSHADKSGRR